MGGLKVAKCGKRTFSFSSSTEYTVTTLQHAELASRAPESLGTKLLYRQLLVQQWRFLQTGEGLRPSISNLVVG